MLEKLATCKSGYTILSIYADDEGKLVVDISAKHNIVDVTISVDGIHFTGDLYTTNQGYRLITDADCYEAEAVEVYIHHKEGGCSTYPIELNCLA